MEMSCFISANGLLVKAETLSKHTNPLGILRPESDESR